MNVGILYAGSDDRAGEMIPELLRALESSGVAAEVLRVPCDPAKVDYIVHAPNGPVVDFTPYTNVKAVLSLWAGVEDVVGNETLTAPLARMVDPDLTAGMVEWVAGHALRHHLGMDAHIVNPDRAWKPSAPKLARERKVTILGLGRLGSACARTLASLNFQVSGWSRGPKTVDGVRCLSGDGALLDALSGAEIVALLLPLTSETENIMDAEAFGALAPGATVLNPGRGPLIDDGALLEALDSGRVGHATLDTFRTEPLPPDDPYWTHPRVTVTPHIASETRSGSAADSIARNIRRGESGETFLHLVNRGAGY